MRYFLVFIKKLFLDIFGELLIVPIGIFYYLVFYNNKKDINIVLCNHIGDIIFTLGYLEEYKLQKNVKNINLIGTNKWKNLVGLYPNIYNEYYTIKSFWLKILLYSAKREIGQSVYLKLKNVIFIDPGNNYTMGYNYAVKFPNSNLKDCIKYGCLNLEADSKFLAPHLILHSNKIKNFINDNNLLNKKAILLCPYASVTNEIGNNFFEKLVTIYKRMGYLVITNISNDEKAIKGTITIKCNFQEIFELGHYMECIIGLRSGILDLLVFTNKLVISIYPKDNNMINFFDLCHTQENKNKLVLQYVMTNDYYKDIKYIIKNHKNLSNN